MGDTFDYLGGLGSPGGSVGSGNVAYAGAPAGNWANPSGSATPQGGFDFASLLQHFQNKGTQQQGQAPASAPAMNAGSENSQAATAASGGLKNLAGAIGGAGGAAAGGLGAVGGAGGAAAGGLGALGAL